MTIVIARAFRRHRLDPKAPVLGRMGSLKTRLARSKAEIRAAQEIRYQVFYKELDAQPSASTRLMRRDKDRYDKHCDHLLVIDNSLGKERIVGTYRLLPGHQARIAGGFYTQNEFDISKLLQGNADKRLLELGRSCILPQYRSKRTIELLWQGLWAYILSNGIDVMFGCASFQGTDPRSFSSSLAWLGHNAALSDLENCEAKGVDALALTAHDTPASNTRAAFANIPPLLKGYLRVGAKVGSHAVVDHQFNTTDVLVVLKVSDINPRYIAHYGEDASRFAA